MHLPRSLDLVLGCVSIILGIYVFLVATGVVRVSKNAEKNEQWRKKYGKLMLVCSILIVLNGVVHLL